MHRRHLLLILLFASLAYSPIFFRQLPYEYDSFYYLQQVCQKQGFEGQPIGVIALFPLLPCDINALRLVNLALLLGCTLFAAKTGSLFSQKGWLAGIFAFATPVFLLEFWKFENDAFGYLFCFAAAYFFFKGLKESKWKSCTTGLALASAGCLFWEGSLLWLLAFGLSTLYLVVPMLIAFIVKAELFIGNVRPKFGSATENLPAFGLLYQMFLLPGLMFIKHIPLLVPATLCFTIIAFVNAKFAIHASFMLAIYAVQVYEKGKTAYLRFMPLAGAITVCLFLTAMLPDLPPDGQEQEAVMLAVAEAGGKTICNDWGTGHLIAYFGGTPLARGGGKQACDGCEGCIVLSYREFNCPILNEAKNDTEIKVYKC